MQPILDGPRAGLTEALVRALLQSHRTIQIKYGAIALDQEFAEVADLANYMSAGSEITSNLAATIHRICSLNIDGDVGETGWSYLSGYVKPYMDIIDPQSLESARFHLGVYVLTTPTRNLGTVPATLNFAGYDLVHLLRQPIADSYEVPVGTDPAQAAADVLGIAIPGAEARVAASGTVTTKRMTWVLDPAEPVTYYQIISELLAGVGYRPIWFDWEGVARIEPFTDLQGSTPEWTFSIEHADTLLSEERAQELDLFNVPNWWRFVIADLPDLPVEGVSMFTWEDHSAVNPGSILNRGRIVRHVQSVPAPTYDELKEFALRRIVETLSPAETFRVKTQPFPLAWHYDVVEYVDSGLEVALPTESGSRRKAVAVEWRLPLDGQTDMEWSWRTVSDQTAALGLDLTITE